MSIKLRRPAGVISVGLLAAFLTAVFKSMDNITVHHFITSTDRLSAASAFLVVGGWTVTSTGFVAAFFIGKLVYPTFTGLVLRNPRMHKSAVLAGMTSAVGNLLTLLGYQFGDPSAFAALSGAMLIYTAFYDVAIKKATFKLVLVPVLLAVIGGGCAAYNGSLALTGISVLLVLVLGNGFSASSEILEQKGIHASDPLSTLAWRLLYMAIFGTCLALLMSTLRGKNEELFHAMRDGLRVLPFLVLTSVVVFFGLGLKMVLKQTHAVWVVLLTLSTQVLFAYPITVIGDLVHPGLFGPLPTSLVVWCVRILGAILLVWGMLQLKSIDLAVKQKTAAKDAS